MARSLSAMGARSVVWRLPMTAVRLTVSMLLRREGETVTQLLTRLDVAIAKALTEGICTVEVNPINQQYFPKK